MLLTPPKPKEKQRNMIFSPKVSPKFLCTHSSLFCSCVAEEENFSSSLFLSVHYFTHIFLQIHSTFSHPIQSTTHPSSLPFHSFFDPLFLHANSLFWVSFIFRISLSPHCDYLLIPNWCLVAENHRERKNNVFPCIHPLFAQKFFSFVCGVQYLRLHDPLLILLSFHRSSLEKLKKTRFFLIWALSFFICFFFFLIIPYFPSFFFLLC